MKTKILASIAALALSTEIVRAQAGDRYGCFGFYGMMKSGYGFMGFFGFIVPLLVIITLVLLIFWLIKQIQNPKRR